MSKKLPHDLFLKTFNYVPRPALCLIIKNSKGNVLLTKREKPPFSDIWHFPGSFLLKDETINNCLLRIGKEELGININPNKTRLLGVFEDIDKDPRGHVINILYNYTSEDIPLKSPGDTKEICFFSSLPEHIGFNHREVLEKLGFT